MGSFNFGKATLTNTLTVPGWDIEVREGTISTDRRIYDENSMSEVLAHIEKRYPDKDVILVPAPVVGLVRKYASSAVVEEVGADDLVVCTRPKAPKAKDLDLDKPFRNESFTR
jgi:hypothetical protein